MKKIVLGFAALPLLAMLATSCNKETVESKDDLGKVITFKAATGKQTLGRSIEVDLGWLQANAALEVRSYNSDDATPYNVFNIQYSGGAWTYGTTPVFHPTGFELTHFSVYPLDNVANISVSNASGEVIESFDYTVQAEDIDQEDLMVASAETNSSSVTDATANLMFKHILSQVNFAIQGAVGYKITINGITVTGVNDSGTYTFGSGWDNLSGDADYEYNPLTGTDATDGTSNDIIYMGNASASTLDNANALMLMPQSFVSSGAGLTLDYTLTGMDDVMFDSDSAFFVKFSDLSVTEWESGKRYLYLISFNPVLIQFEVSIFEDWVDYDGAGGVVEVKKN